MGSQFSITQGTGEIHDSVKGKEKDQEQKEDISDTVDLN